MMDLASIPTCSTVTTFRIQSNQEIASPSDCMPFALLQVLLREADSKKAAADVPHRAGSSILNFRRIIIIKMLKAKGF
jgi:hypothetical protein